MDGQKELMRERVAAIFDGGKILETPHGVTDTREALRERVQHRADTGQHLHDDTRMSWIIIAIAVFVLANLTTVSWLLLSSMGQPP